MMVAGGLLLPARVMREGFGIVLFVSRAIHDAVETGMLEMVRVLVEHGADPCTEHLDKTPCEMARALGHTEIHNYLQGKAHTIINNLARMT